MPKGFWAKAVATTVYDFNRTTSTTNREKTPYELWYGKAPKIDHLKVFGSISYACVPTELRRKFDDKSIKCIFVGYAKIAKSYKLYDPISKRTVINRR